MTLISHVCPRCKHAVGASAKAEVYCTRCRRAGDKVPQKCEPVVDTESASG